MTSIHVRKVDDNLLARLKQEARQQKLSVNTLVLVLLRYGLGMERRRKLPVYHDLDQFIGTWGADDLKEFKKNMADFEKIDEDLWR
jgi:hypothetical protein